MGKFKVILSFICLMYSVFALAIYSPDLAYQQFKTTDNNSNKSTSGQDLKGVYFNLAMYAQNNPISNHDPSGNMGEKLEISPFTGGGGSNTPGIMEDSRSKQWSMEGGGNQTGLNLRFDGKLNASSPTTSGPNYIVSPGGTAYPVPKGATGPVPVVNAAGKVTGSAFTGGVGGANNQVSTMRIMNATPLKGNAPAYPSGYIKYEKIQPDGRLQGVNPYTGQTGSRSGTHFPID